MYLVQLDQTSKKYLCPQCGQRKFVLYVYTDTKSPVDETRFGRCDRENNCAYHLHPNSDPSSIKSDHTPKPDPRTIFILPSKDQIRAVVDYENKSSLHHYLNKLNIPDKHIRKWGVYSHRYYPQKTVYLFQRKVDFRIVNWKVFSYLENGHRDKKFESYSLSVPEMYYLKEREFFMLRYPMCLFGEHLFTNELKPTKIVESEKSAVIASWYYPQFDWVSCGSDNGLTFKSRHKLNALHGRSVDWLCDADKAGRNNQSINALQKTITDFRVTDLFPDRNDGYDIADSIAEGYLPELK